MKYILITLLLGLSACGPSLRDIQDVNMRYIHENTKLIEEAKKQIEKNEDMIFNVCTRLLQIESNRHNLDNQQAYDFLKECLGGE